METRTCKYEDCGRRLFARGWCQAHYTMAMRGQELRPVATYKLFASPAPGKKICTLCERVKDIATDFYERKPGKPTNRCKECMKAEEAKRRKERKANEVRTQMD